MHEMRQHRSTQGSTATVLAVAAGLLAVLTGCAPAPAPSAAPASTPAPVLIQDANPATLDSLPKPPTQPIALSVPDLNIDMPIEPHGLDEVGAMSLPETPFSAAWYQYGSGPDSQSGSTVLAAHVDDRDYGVGPFSRIRDAQPGMVMSVTDQAGVVHTYSVAAVERIPRAEVPLDRVFTAVGDPTLVLITCGGQFNESTRSYSDNYIVTAEKVS
ncbi:MAG: class F sortase [Microbacteriaceae bacterium]|nr:class F sortase [Microbacteriaceae bacterium]